MNELTTADIMIIATLSLCFISMIAAGVLASICNNRPRCFGVKYDDYERELLGCDQCNEEEECLG